MASHTDAIRSACITQMSYDCISKMMRTCAKLFLSYFGSSESPKLLILHISDSVKTLITDSDHFNPFSSRCALMMEPVPSWAIAQSRHLFKNCDFLVNRFSLMLEF